MIDFDDFSQSLRANADCDCILIRLLPLPSESFPSNHSSVAHSLAMTASVSGATGEHRTLPGSVAASAIPGLEHLQGSAASVAHVEIAAAGADSP